jgi:hypothetical protein
MNASLASAVLADSDSGKGGPIGLFVVLLLIIAVYFLYRSMSGHLRRLPEKFPGYDQSTNGPPTTNPPTNAAPPAEADQPGPGETEGGPTRPS